MAIKYSFADAAKYEGRLTFLRAVALALTVPALAGIYWLQAFMGLPYSMAGILLTAGVLTSLAYIFFHIRGGEKSLLENSKQQLREVNKDNLVPVPSALKGRIQHIASAMRIHKKLSVFVTNHPLIARYYALVVDGHFYIHQDLLDRLNRNEMDFVLAHELSHIKNRDFDDEAMKRGLEVFFIISTAIAAVFSLASTVAGVSTLPAMIVTLGCLFAIPLQRYLQSAISRTREYRADHMALAVTQDFESASASLLKTDPKHYKKMPWRRRMKAVHPIGIDRIRAMERLTRTDGKYPACEQILAYGQR